MSKQVLRNEEIFDNISDWLTIIDLDSNIKYTNKSGEKLFGLTKDKIINQKCCRLVHNKDSLMIDCPFKKMLKSKKQENAKLFLEEKNQLIEVTVIPIFDKNKKITSATHIVKDITEKMKTEEFFSKSEEKYQNIVDLVPDAIITLNLKGFITSCNEQALNFGDYNTKEELIGKHISQLKSFRKRDIPKLIKTFLKVTKGSKIIPPYNFQFIGKEGKLRWAEGRYRLQYENKKLIGIQSIIRDITDRKKAEEDLKESEEKYRSIVDSSKNVIVRADCNGIINYINHTVSDISKDKVIGKTLYDFINPKYHKLVKKTLKKVINTGKPETYQLQGVGPRDSSAWYHNTISPIKFEGKINAVTIITENITNQKKAEETIKESEEKYRLIIKTAPTIITIIDKNFIIKDINYTISGIDKKDVIGKKIFEFIEPRFRKKVEKTLQYVIKYKKSSQYEIQGKGPNSSIAWYDTRVGPIIKEGKVTEIIIMGTDITERKRREREIQKQFMKYDIEEGNCYLVLEKSNLKATNAFDDILKTGYNGIILSRGKIKDLKTQINNDFSYLWLSEKPYKNSINPKNIEKYMEQIKKSSVILLNRLDYILHKLGFDKTLSLIQSINEFAYMNNHIILISIDPDIIGKKELSMIEKETIDLEPKQKIKLDYDQIKILKYIHMENLKNNKPSYTNLCNFFNCSKPTIRSKIRILKEKGYLIEYKSGNKKQLEISDKTRSILT